MGVKARRVGAARRSRGRRGRRPGLIPFLLMSAVFILAATAVGKDRVQKPPAAYVEEIAPLCEKLGEELPLVLAVIQAESRFRENIRSPKGAVGLMQVMPDTAGWMAEQLGLEDYADEKLYEREWNLIIGISYLRYLQQLFPDNLAQTLAAYNAGPNRVKSWTSAGDWDGSAGKLEDIPYAETRNYVKKVLKIYDNYRRIY